LKQEQFKYEAPDGDLVVRMNNGEDGVFDTIYQRHRDWVYRMAARLTGSPQMADDVLQDTFCYFLGKFPGFDLRCELRTFLYPVVRNLSWNILKKSRRYESGPQADAHFDRLEAPSPDPIASQDILGITASLSVDHREILFLRFVDGMTLQEIAEMTGIPLGTAKSRLHHALSALRETPAIREIRGKNERFPMSHC
jgi:RNA polymerase sigma-70 factor (ECF subfamily)